MQNQDNKEHYCLPSCCHPSSDPSFFQLFHLPICLWDLVIKINALRCRNVQDHPLSLLVKRARNKLENIQETPNFSQFFYYLSYSSLCPLPIPVPVGPWTSWLHPSSTPIFFSQLTCPCFHFLCVFFLHSSLTSRSQFGHVGNLTFNCDSQWFYLGTSFLTKSTLQIWCFPQLSSTSIN